jgi:3-dehydroquinate synthase
MSSALRLRTVEVFLGERSYPIHLGAGTLAGAGDAIARHTKATHAVVVTVPIVGRRYAGTLLRSLRQAGLRTTRIEVPDGDAAKTLRQTARLYQRLLASQADRSSVVVALGGGAVGDLAGFAAATYLRGVAFVQVPTTVLSMVDASIGGKVAVNLPEGKNLVGAFYQPRLVWIDVATLRSLPLRARAAGLAEVVKAAAIRDAGFFADLERDAERLLELDEAALLPALERACAIKAKVVSQDEHEQGLRMLLNFGHTLAHAVEVLMGYRRVLHGEAVSMGMAFAARRSEQLGCAPAGTAARLCALLGRLGLPTELPALPRSAYLRALKVDKKRRDARIHYIVLRGIGRAESVPLTAAEILPGSPGAARRQGGGKR